MPAVSHRNAFFACLLVFASHALGAQSRSEPDASASDVMPDIVVTGSRLRGPGMAEAMPVTVIDRASLIETGHQSLGEALQALPFMSGAPLSTSVNARGSGGGLSRGTETIELRGLGPERTLVLVNGRRFLPGGNGVAGLVDLGMLPVAMIERVEILKTGASVEYGADAVAGVVNVITRQEVGQLLSASWGQTDRGDGQSRSLEWLYGQEGAAGRFLIGVSWQDQDAVGKGDRRFSRELLTVSGPDNQIQTDGSSAPPLGNHRTSDGRLILREGEDGRQPEDFRPFISRGPDNDRYNFNPFEDLRQDSERLSVFGSWTRQIHPDIDAFMEWNWQQRKGDTRLAPLPFFTNRLTGVSVSADNAFNPFGEEIADARRRLVEAGPREFIQDNRSARLLLGLEGQWVLGHWDGSLAYGENRSDQTQTGDVLADRVALALGPSHEDAGQLRCGEAGNAIAGCVPLNIFAGPGAITDPMLDYISAGNLRDRQENAQWLLNLNASGSGFELHAGELEWAAGYEFRRETAKDVPAAATQAGNTSGAARSLTRGDIDSHEVYGEIGLPLLADRPGVQALDLDLGLRMVSFSAFDEAFVYDARLRYQPIQDVVMRLAYSRAFRAPTILELFGGESQSNPAVDDPCADFSQLDQAEIDRCVAQGVPDDGSFNQTGNETPQLGGGNADLEPERSRSWTAGISWQPAALSGLNVSLDVYAIEVVDAIASLGANTVLAQCLATGADDFCGRIQRDRSGAIQQVQTRLQNIASETARGADLELRYAFSRDWGRLSQSLFLSYVDQRDVVAFPGAAPFVGVGEYDSDKFGAIPRWKAQYRFGWSGDAWDLRYALQWIDSLRERGGEIFPGTRRRVDERIYHDLSLAWQPDQHWQARLALRNLEDRDPPFLANADVANTDVSTYRLLGRNIRLDLQYRF